MLSQPALNTITPQIPTLPEPITLDNGIQLNVVPVDTTDLVNVAIMFNGGHWVQQRCLQPELALRQITSGNGTMTAAMIDEQIDFYGATLYGGSSINWSFVNATALKRTLPEVLAIMAETIASPTYEEARFQHGVQEELMAHKISMQKTDAVCRRLFNKHLFGQHHPMAQYPEIDDYSTITRNDALAYHKAFLHTGNAVIYVAGRIDDEAVVAINRTLGALPTVGTPITIPHIAEHTPQTLRVTSHTEVPSPQSSIQMGMTIPHSLHKDYPALLLLSTVLGGYFGSRLMTNIRERLGLTYGIASRIIFMPQNNVFTISTEVSSNEVEHCIDEIHKDIRSLQTTPISDEEMTQAKNYQLGSFCRSTEASHMLLPTLMNNRAIGRTLQDMLQCQLAIQSLTPDDVMEMANKYLNENQMLVAVVNGADL